MKNRIVLLAVSGSFLFVLYGCHKEENPFPNHVGGKIFQGQKNVNVRCTGCHGALGGGGMRAPSLISAVKNLTLDQFVATVRNGKGKMPAYGGVLKEEDILQIVDWLQKLS